ncbi:MAG: glycerol-3-phosphate 1-O-acyltransferase PlsY [Verrucomicrobiae bacterium]|nr:glycerol-3-phosphate 1-O-acyltransferase PlsY [Verrucomicrobiae bacterium]
MKSSLWWIALAAGYGLGAIPFGFLLGKAKGVDVRRQGSGNIGATNVWRVLGRPWGIATFLLDFLKAPLAILLAEGWARSRGADAEAVTWCGIAAFAGAILGHNFPVWLRFRGGKGVASSAGGLLALMPTAFLAIVGVWVVVFFLSRIVSLASLAGALTLPFAAWFLVEPHAGLRGLACLLAVMIVVRHRANIGRLLAGTEHRWSKKTVPETGGQP